MAKFVVTLEIEVGDEALAMKMARSHAGGFGLEAPDSMEEAMEVLTELEVVPLDCGFEITRHHAVRAS